MLVFSDYRSLPDEARGAIVALGNFDGVHRGHAALLAAARAEADAQGCRLAVLTFEPHPRSFFRPDDAPFRLTTPAIKSRLLRAAGVDILYVLKFDTALAQMSAGDFQDAVLQRGLSARGVAAGSNFRFGYQREGTLQSLAYRDAALTIITPPIVGDAMGAEISSSRIREALADGRPGMAADMLGRWWQIDYTVETGDRRGRELGYPTANGRLGELLRPAYGVYAVMVRLADGRVFRGAANIGVRPMWRSDQPLVESFLFDMSEDIYGQILSLHLVEYLRGEAHFPDIETLKEQMARDCDQSRAILEAVNI